MIHDAGAKSILIGGLKRRGFSEAMPYKQNGYLIVPQMCWNCDSTRELSIETLSIAEIQARQKAQRPRKQRGRKCRGEVESVFDELFGE